MEVTFKLFTPSEADDILNMMTAFNAIDGYSFDPEIGKRNLNEFTSREELGRLYLIKNNELTIGYLVLAFGFSFEYQGRDAFIDEFYIKKDFRNKGAGKLVMDFIASEAERLKIKAIHLEVESHNLSATKLYEGKGYKSSNRRLLTKRIK